MKRRIGSDNNCINHRSSGSDESNRMRVDFINDGIYRPYASDANHPIHRYRPTAHHNTSIATYHCGYGPGVYSSVNTSAHAYAQTGGAEPGQRVDYDLNDEIDQYINQAQDETEDNTSKSYLSQDPDQSPDSEIDMDEMNDLIDSPTPEDMIGGAVKGMKKRASVFKSGYTMYMIADATEPKMLGAYQARLDRLGISKKEQSKIKPHISLMQVQINKANPDHLQIIGADGMIRSGLERELENAYKTLSPQMYLISRKGKYEIMGEFMAKVYKAVNSSYITSFRMTLYKYLEKKLGPSKRKVAILNGKKYFVYSYGGRDLIAVPEYYHGKGVWTPHLSLIRLDKLEKANPQLYDTFQRTDVKTLVNALIGVKGTLDQVILGYHFGSFRTSII